MADGDTKADPPRTEGGQFIQGFSGNPTGRPRGARAKLGEAFCQDVQAKWQERGEEVLTRMIDERPHEFAKMVAAMLPSEHKITLADDLSELTDAELAERVRRVTEQLAALALGGSGSTDAGAKGARGAAQPSRVH